MTEATMKSRLDEYIAKAKEFADKLVYLGQSTISGTASKPIQKITKSQIRKFLAQVNKIKSRAELIQDDGWKVLQNQVLMLEPRLKYQIAKDDKLSKDHEVKKFADYTSNILQSIRTKQDFLEFASFIEAFTAYHRANGGGE